MILSDKHREVEALSVYAAEATSQGRVKEAIEIYGKAAKLEEQALEEIPPDKTRTRSVLSVSVASLLYKAQMLDDAENAIFSSLASRNLEPWAETQLRELLSVVSDERLLAKTLHQRYSGESIVFALRGGEIGSGTGPLDLILEKASGFRSLLYRFAELIADYPLRTQGNPPKDVIDLIQARATEPALGSYRLEIRLTEPLQEELFGPSRLRPRILSDTLFQFLGGLTRGDYRKLEEVVPQLDYRRALLQLTRNVTPSGKRIKEIGIYRKQEMQTESVYLTEALPEKIKEVMPRQQKESGKKYGEIHGTLRALHLDKNWLELTLPNKEPVRCDTRHDMLDDVVGPMVNREVIVRGPTRLRRGVSCLLVEEIELAEES